MNERKIILGRSKSRPLVTCSMNPFQTSILGVFHDFPYNQTCYDCMENHQLPQICSFGTGYDTVFISPFEASERSKGHFQKTCFITFDQPLFFKARDIVEGGQHSELSCVVVRLGDFHLLMTFMGCIYTDHRPGQDAEWSCLFTGCTSTYFD
jgi:hypothetical protein